MEIHVPVSPLFSVFESKPAVDESSGSQKKIATPRSTATLLNTTNMIRQLSATEFAMCWKPKDKKPPVM